MPKNIDLVKTGVVNVFIEFFYSTYEIKQSLKTEKKKLKVIFFVVLCFVRQHDIAESFLC